MPFAGHKMFVHPLQN